MRRKVDIAIITAKAEEYEAVRLLLNSPQPWKGTQAEPTPWAWTVGFIPQRDSDKYYSVALALTHEQTNVSAALASKDTINTFEPRYVILLGIAGSLKNWVSQGDVVVGEYIWGYEYGRVQESGRSVLRHLFRVTLDNRLKSSAEAFSMAVPDWSKAIGAKPGTDDQYPKLSFGGIASGEKVLESVEPDICKAILEGDPDLCAVDMESHGTAQAVRQEAESRSIGLMVIRGVSDVPIGVNRRRVRRTVGSQQATRNEWTKYASKAAAFFAYRFIVSHFPFEATNEILVAETPSASNGSGLTDKAFAEASQGNQAAPAILVPNLASDEMAALEETVAVQTRSTIEQQLQEPFVSTTAAETFASVDGKRKLVGFEKIEYICYISRSKIDQLYAQVDVEESMTEGTIPGNSVLHPDLKYGRYAIQFERQVKREYLRKLQTVVHTLERDNQILSFAHLMSGAINHSPFFSYTGSFSVVTPMVSGLPPADGITTIESTAENVRIRLDCSLRNFSEGNQGNDSFQLHSGNRFFFTGEISLTFETVAIAMAIQNGILVGSPLFLTLRFPDGQHVGPNLIALFV